MGKEDLAELIDAYADAKSTGNQYLCKGMITQLENALTELYARLDKAAPADNME